MKHMRKKSLIINFCSNQTKKIYIYINIAKKKKESVIRGNSFFRSCGFLLTRLLNWHNQSSNTFCDVTFELNLLGTNTTTKKTSCFLFRHFRVVAEELKFFFLNLKKKLAHHK